MGVKALKGWISNNGSHQQLLSKNCTSGATIGLFAARGKEGFYKKFDFVERTGENLGLGMCKFP
jgi:hypothetical protein